MLLVNCGYQLTLQEGVPKHGSNYGVLMAARTGDFQGEETKNMCQVLPPKVAL